MQYDGLDLQNGDYTTSKRSPMISVCWTWVWIYQLLGQYIFRFFPKGS